jgi:hypothetical protein
MARSRSVLTKTKTDMKTTMKLAFAFLVFFGFAVGAKGQVEYTTVFTQTDSMLMALTTPYLRTTSDRIPKGSVLDTLLSFAVSDDGLRSNDSAWRYGSALRSYQTYTRSVFHIILAMRACGADSVRWTEDPNKDDGLFNIRRAVPEPIVRYSLPMDALVRDLARTTALGVRYLKQYSFFASK